MEARYPGKRYTGLWIFGVTLGFFEAAIVVYLRQIVCPGGFQLPLAHMDMPLLTVELAREMASLIMLAGVALAAARKRREVLPVFFLVFGIWDIFYYVFLKITLNWPESLATWDLLFLVPAPWSSPVWAPVLVALLFTAVPSFILLRGVVKPYTVLDRTLMTAGGAVVLVSFLYNARTLIAGGVPESFPLFIYIPGLLLMLIGSVKGLTKNDQPLRHDLLGL